jgi:hypothetical protein
MQGVTLAAKVMATLRPSSKNNSSSSTAATASATQRLESSDQFMVEVEQHLNGRLQYR